MTTPHRTILALACATVLGGVPLAHAADHASMTLYRSDNAALYASSSNGGTDDGYAVIREQRTLTLQSGTHDVVLGDLPDHIDAEALALGFPDGSAKVISQRLLLAQGADAAMTGLVGQNITVLGSNGETLAQGTLLRAGDGLLVHSASGTTLVRQYAAVRANSHFPTGSSLDLRVDAARAGNTQASATPPPAWAGALPTWPRCNRAAAAACSSNRAPASPTAAAATGVT
jgi:hypothetical protein